MSAAAAAAAAPGAPGDPGSEFNTPQDHDRWFNLDPASFAELCQNAYRDGDYSYVSVALRANHEGMKAFIERSAAAGVRTISNDESYGLLLMTQKMISLLLSLVNMYVEKESRQLRGRLDHIEENVDTAKATIESVNKIAELIVESKQMHPGSSKPVSEFKSVQQLRHSQEIGARSVNGARSC